MPKQYAREFRRAACERLVAGEKVSALSKELGVSEGSLYLWKRQALIDAGRAEGIKHPYYGFQSCSAGHGRAKAWVGFPGLLAPLSQHGDGAAWSGTLFVGANSNFRKQSLDASEHGSGEWSALSDR